MSKHTVKEVKRLYSATHDNLLRNAKREGHRGIRHGYHDRDQGEAADAMDRMRRELVETAQISADDHVLDIGCGFGEDAAWIAEHIGAAVVGVNISEQQIAVARDLAETNRVRFVVDDFHELSSIADNSVDVVWGLEALCHAHSIRAVIDQVSRTLVDGGRIVFADLFQPPATTRNSSPSIQRASSGLRVSFEPLETLLDALEEAGFGAVSYEDVTRSIVPSAKRFYWYGVLAYPLYRLKSLVTRSDRDRQLAASARGHSHQYKAIERGELTYAIVSAKRSV